MAHYRPRQLEDQLRKLLNFSPIVGLFGHRQVGKTSLVERIAGTYVTFDKLATISAASADPEMFVGQFERFPVVIDECQLVPAVFPALKEHVRIHKKPGQFLLTGSVRFSSKRDIRESLTGRIVTLDLPPLGVSEILENPPTKALRILALKSMESFIRYVEGMTSERIALAALTTSFNKYPIAGGLPGACFVRNASLRTQRFESQIETILERDLKLLIDTTLPFRSLRRVLELIALRTGQPINYADIARQSRVSVPTIRRLVRAFEALFLIELLEVEGDEARPSVFFVDSGEGAHLAEGRTDELTTLTQTIFCQINASLSGEALELGKGGAIQWFQFRTRGGSYIPLALRVSGKIIGIAPMLSENPDASTMASVRSFLKRFPLATVLLPHRFHKLELIQPRVLSLPAIGLCT